MYLSVFFCIFLRNFSYHRCPPSRTSPQACLLQLIFIIETEELAVMGLSSIYDRRVRGNLIQHFKLVNGQNDVSWVNPMVQSSSLSHSGRAKGIRGHRRILSGQYSKVRAESQFLHKQSGQRVECLPASVSVNQFKSRYDALKASTNMLPSNNPAY